MRKIPALSPTGLAIDTVLIGGNLAAALTSGPGHVLAVVAMAFINAMACLCVIGSFIAVRKAQQAVAIYRALAALQASMSKPDGETEDVQAAFERLVRGE